MKKGIEEVNTKSFHEVYDRKYNAFDIMRFILALMVIYSHSYPLFYGAGQKGDILARISNGQIDFGMLAIICFFVISGFLITQSLMNSKGYVDYFYKRSLRIFPALLASAVFFSVIVGPLISNLGIKDYFNSTVLRYIIDTISLNMTGFHSTVNDLFATNIFPSAINGSAWSLKHEFACYIIVAILYFFNIYKHKILLLVSTAIVLILLIININTGFNLYQSGWWVFIEPEKLIKLLFYFLTGSIIYVFKDKIYYDNRFVVLAVLILILALKLGVLQYAMLICLPYLLLSICVKVNFSSFNKYGDFSYGMYIYAFPVQQTVMYLMGNSLNIISFFVISSLCTLILSVLSWKIVEEPALRYKNVKFKIPFSIRNRSSIS